jgi:hypothetical protein
MGPLEDFLELTGTNTCVKLENPLKRLKSCCKNATVLKKVVDTIPKLD